MDDFVEQLENLICKCDEIQKKSKHNDLSDLPKMEVQSLVTRSISAIHRISGSKSTYSMEVKRLFVLSPSIHLHAVPIFGVLKALLDDFRDGYLKTLVEIAHADIFDDFLDMACHLSEAGYKDAAAVIAGSTLESHLKESCLKHGIPIELNGKSVKADKLNADLAKAGVYGKLDQKNVVAWLDLRNKAAHGNYSEYTAEQVELLISAVRDFIGRVSA